ncbi:glyoxylate/hydroxypyruvate reductase A [Pseudoroseomonas deserti]|uniref:Glyoxylate/hydroxypyruvate reductase A n=1 Tax=Teichococcus deserti TaxID=1817963 RepID=A0A1V2GXF2_9PROT|nr:glyoxylate/hydroxypyruvate reductase A [Pseudoroseomonas deserti]ONG49406.1 glyoxylate/hydroxypyruvate reductase A [Pseudoroseomonas deserti]
MSILLIGSLDDDDYADWKTHLLAHLPAGETLVLANEPHDVDAVEIALVANPPHGTLARYPNLRFVQSLWAGVDRMLSDPTLPTAIPISRLVDPALTQAMVECALASVLLLHRQLPAYVRQQARAEWKQLAQPLAGQRRVGVLGLGALGGACATALAGIGFAVSGWSRAPKAIDGVACLSGGAGMEQLVATSDILVNLLPLTPDTMGILDARLFGRLPQGAGLVNLARGRHLVEADLLAALSSGQVSHAVLDVFAQEPLPGEHPFWAHPGITVLPHVAAYSAPESAARIALENVARHRAGQPTTAMVDPARGY